MSRVRRMGSACSAKPGSRGALGGAPVRRGAVRDVPGDGGFATVLVLGLALVLVLLGAAATSLGAVAVARQRAASAADLSALAAAGLALEGEAAACGRASGLALRVGARLALCRLEGDVAVVVAEVRPPGPLARLGVAAARARAGPVPGRDGAGS